MHFQVAPALSQRVCKHREPPIGPRTGEVGILARKLSNQALAHTGGCIGNPKLEQDSIEGTHARETPAYQRRPTTLHEVQGNNPHPVAL